MFLDKLSVLITTICTPVLVLDSLNWNVHLTDKVVAVLELTLRLDNGSGRIPGAMDGVIVIAISYVSLVIAKKLIARCN